MKNVKILGLILVLILAGACKKEDDVPLPTPKADIFGFAELYDNGTNQVDQSGMKIYIEGKENAFYSTTNSEGKFSIKDVELGTYTIVYAKNGYGTHKIFDIKVKADEDHVSLNTPSLGQLSTTKITSLSVNIDGSDVVLTYETDPAGNSTSPKYVRYFFNDNSGVSSSEYTYHTAVYQINNSPHEKRFSEYDLTDMGFNSGDEIFVKVYSDSFWSNEYDNPTLNRKIFPNLNSNSADEVSFVIP